MSSHNPTDETFVSLKSVGRIGIEVVLKKSEGERIAAEKEYQRQLHQLPEAQQDLVTEYVTKWRKKITAGGTRRPRR